MVDGEVLSGSAILAFVSIPSEKVGPIQQNALVGYVTVLVETNDGRVSEFHANGTYHQGFIKRKATHFLQKSQDQRLLNRHDRNGTMIQIQNQNTFFHSS